MKKSHGKSEARGRPRKPETTELVSALAARQVAVAERTAAKINDILATHIRRGDAARGAVRIVDRSRRVLSTLPDRAQARIPDLGVSGATEIQRLVEEALSELVVTDEERALAMLPPLPDEPRAVAEPVGNLAAARAQSARLHARLIELKQRIVPIPHRRGLR